MTARERLAAFHELPRGVPQRVEVLALVIACDGVLDSIVIQKQVQPTRPAEA